MAVSIQSKADRSKHAQEKEGLVRELKGCIESNKELERRINAMNMKHEEAQKNLQLASAMKLGHLEEQLSKHQRFLKGIHTSISINGKENSMGSIKRNLF